MSSNNDEIRWQQRLEHFEAAVARLLEALDEEDLSPLERTGMIKHFEMSYELAWKTLKDLLTFEGFDEATSPKSTLRLAHQTGWIDPIDRWMDMHEARNLATHTYDEDDAITLANNIRELYADELAALAKRLRAKAQAT